MCIFIYMYVSVFEWIFSNLFRKDVRWKLRASSQIPQTCPWNKTHTLGKVDENMSTQSWSNSGAQSVCVCLLEEPIEMTPSIQDIQVVQAIRLRKSEVSTKLVQASCVLLVCPATSFALSSRALRMKPTQQTSGRCRTCTSTVHCMTFWDHG